MHTSTSTRTGVLAIALTGATLVVPMVTSGLVPAKAAPPASRDVEIRVVSN